MTAFSASAPGKAILFGEHAVVYGQPAIAIPIHQVSVKAIVKADILAPEGRISVQSEAIGLDATLSKLSKDDALSMAIRNTLKHFSVERAPAFQLKIVSDIPVASGLGSGAAVSAAVIRAVAGFLGQTISDAAVSAIAYESEKSHHGTPSGIDNTVVSFGKAVYFEKGREAEVFEIGRPFDLLIADTGVASKTKAVVDQVRASWQENAALLERIFKDIGAISQQARKAMRLGDIEKLGVLMNQNQSLLAEMGVSSPELERLVLAALNAGALGAKLSGAGQGGNMIALGAIDKLDDIERALRSAGAQQIIRSHVQ